MIKSRKITSLLTVFIMTLSFVLIGSNTNKVEAATKPGVAYSTHIQNEGWEKDFSKSNGQISGTQGKSYRLEGIKIKLTNNPDNIKIKYQVHVQNEGWQGWKTNGAIAGTEGKSYRLEGIRICLENSNEYSVRYKVHVQNEGWQGWKYDGEMAGTEGKSYRLEGIIIEIVPKKARIEYRSHVQNIGWQGYVSDGEMSGTSGMSYRVEGFYIRLVNAPKGAKIRYRAHVQNVGWQGWRENDQFAGTSGQSLRVEALEMQLVNMPNYDLKYRAHIQDIGWQEGIIRGGKSEIKKLGTSGQSKRIEAIELQLIENDFITNMEFESIPKTSYRLGEDLSLANGKINIKYNSGKTESVNLTSKDVVVTGYDKKKTGEQTITVKYTKNGIEKTIKYTIVVEKNKIIASIDVDNITEQEVRIGGKTITKKITVKNQDGQFLDGENEGVSAKNLNIATQNVTVKKLDENGAVIDEAVRPDEIVRYIQIIANSNAPVGTNVGKIVLSVPEKNVNQVVIANSGVTREKTFNINAKLEPGLRIAETVSVSKYADYIELLPLFTLVDNETGDPVEDQLTVDQIQFTNEFDEQGQTTGSFATDKVRLLIHNLKTEGTVNNNPEPKQIPAFTFKCYNNNSEVNSGNFNSMRAHFNNSAILKINVESLNGKYITGTYKNSDGTPEDFSIKIIVEDLIV